MCKHPLKGFKIGLTVNGKPNYKIVPYVTDHLELRSGIWMKCMNNFVSPYAEKVLRDYVEIPCGKCVDCRLQYSRQWADRCMYELQYYKPEECSFLTITYDEEHIMDIGSDLFSGTLLKSDLSTFMKNLRRQCDYYGYSDKIRFFACGEYGTKTFRPHYHMILYGLNIQKYGQLSFWVKSKSGFNTWRSAFLEKVWKKGMIVVSPVSWDTCAYTARYVLKKASGIKPDDYVANGVEPEFTLMSRKPGIGREFFDDNYLQIYEYDEINIRSPDGGRKAKPPKYFDKLYEKKNPEDYERIRENRKQVAERVRQMKLSQTGLSYEDLLDIEDKILQQKVKLLPRS